jgi:hypothetical protein
MSNSIRLSIHQSQYYHTHSINSQSQSGYPFLTSYMPHISIYLIIHTLIPKSKLSNLSDILEYNLYYQTIILQYIVVNISLYLNNILYIV